MLLSPADCQEAPYKSLKPQNISVAVCPITGSATGRGTSLQPTCRKLHRQRIGDNLDEPQESCYTVAGSATVANRIILESTKVQIHVAGESDIDGIQAVGRSAWRDTYTRLTRDRSWWL
jgi:hypothetical protein